MVLGQGERGIRRQRRPWPRKKYTPLAAWLADQGAAEVTCTVAQIEAVLGEPLPLAASMRTWWCWPSMLLPQQLASAGWGVRAVDTLQGTVTFVRVSESKDHTVSPP